MHLEPILVAVDPPDLRAEVKLEVVKVTVIVYCRVSHPRVH